jgi:hypothetical protein
MSGREDLEVYADTWDALNRQISDLIDKRKQLEFYNIQKTMEELEAEEFTSSNGIVFTFKPAIEWQDWKLDDLGSALADSGLDKEDYLQKPKARLWDKRKIVKLSKQGGDIKQIIDGAKVELSNQLKVKRKV